MYYAYSTYGSLAIDHTAKGLERVLPVITGYVDKSGLTKVEDRDFVSSFLYVALKICGETKRAADAEKRLWDGIAGCAPLKSLYDIVFCIFRFFF